MREGVAIGEGADCNLWSLEMVLLLFWLTLTSQIEECGMPVPGIRTLLLRHPM